MNTIVCLSVGGRRRIGRVIAFIGVLFEALGKTVTQVLWNHAHVFVHVKYLLVIAIQEIKNGLAFVTYIDYREWK